MADCVRFLLGVIIPLNQSVREFKTRSLDLVLQTDLQKYILEDLLGIETKFVFLVQNRGSSADTHLTLSWKQVFAKLNLGNCPKFMIDWIDRL